MSTEYKTWFAEPQCRSPPHFFEVAAIDHSGYGRGFVRGTARVLKRRYSKCSEAVLGLAGQRVLPCLGRKRPRQERALEFHISDETSTPDSVPFVCPHKYRPSRTSEGHSDRKSVV